MACSLGHTSTELSFGVSLTRARPGLLLGLTKLDPQKGLGWGRGRLPLPVAASLADAEHYVGLFLSVCFLTCVTDPLSQTPPIV